MNDAPAAFEDGCAGHYMPSGCHGRCRWLPPSSSERARRVGLRPPPSRRPSWTCGAGAARRENVRVRRPLSLARRSGRRRKGAGGATGRRPQPNEPLAGALRAAGLRSRGSDAASTLRSTPVPRSALLRGRDRLAQLPEEPWQPTSDGEHGNVERARELHRLGVAPRAEHLEDAAFQRREIAVSKPWGGVRGSPFAVRRPVLVRLRTGWRDGRGGSLAIVRASTAVRVAPPASVSRRPRASPSCVSAHREPPPRKRRRRRAGHG